jgi:hydrogenase small subunit
METTCFDTDLDLALSARGVTRRDFMKFCSQIALLLGFAPMFGPRIAKAIESGGPFGKSRRPSVLWLNLQGCTGCTESFARADHPSVARAVLELISLDYHETLMAAAGKQAEDARKIAMTENRGKYILVVEGSLPTAEGGIYCTIAGRSGIDVVQEMSAGAAFVLAVGSCAYFGGLPSAHPDPTQAKGIDQIVPKKKVINLPGCPPIGDVVMATVVHFLLFGRPPSVDSDRRPLFAYGKAVHDLCERRACYEAGDMAAEFGDEEYREGYCLWALGCKGAVTRNACPLIRWNMGTAWCVGSGHPCVGCSERDFWDKLTPIYTTSG